MNIALAYINEKDQRLVLAQGSCLSTLLHFGQVPVIFNGTPRPFLGDMLLEARRLSKDNKFFGWVNSDCVFLAHPEMIAFHGHVVGIQRHESNGSRCDGVDAYIFDCEVWDNLYAKDIPQMYVGGTHVDWWITRLAQKHNLYLENRSLFHRSHPRSETSAGLSPEGQHNIREFNAWADRNGVKKD